MKSFVFESNNINELNIPTQDKNVSFELLIIFNLNPIISVIKNTTKHVLITISGFIV